MVELESFNQLNETRVNKLSSVLALQSIDEA